VIGVFTPIAPLRLQFNEDIDIGSVSTTTIGPVTTGSTPIGGVATFATEPTISSVAVSDADGDPTTGTDGNQVNVTVSNIFLISTGDTLPISGIRDEAGNTFTQTLTLLDTLGPFTINVVAAGNLAGVPDSIIITVSEPLLASSVVGTGALGNPNCTAGFAFSGPGAVFVFVPCVATRAGGTANIVTLSGDGLTITLTFDDGALAAAGFTAATVLNIFGVTDQAENPNAFVNAIRPDGTTGFNIGTVTLP
jgi:hypothetical protein